jgi:tRNA dimethylallyltransferase
MWKMGLVREVQRILDMGFAPSINSLNSVGYKETIAFLNNNVSEQETIEAIKRNTRRFAKRQITWFKKNESIRWFNPIEQNLKVQVLTFLNKFVFFNDAGIAKRKI